MLFKFKKNFVARTLVNKKNYKTKKVKEKLKNY